MSKFAKITLLALAVFLVFGFSITVNAKPGQNPNPSFDVNVINTPDVNVVNTPDGFIVWRSYYLTKAWSTGVFDPDTVCEDGYHMASIFELKHPTEMVYNTDLGFIADDSGYGPSTRWGWVRSGWPSSIYQNCSVWTSTGGEGLMAHPSLSNPSGWTSIPDLCAYTHHYWCISDVTP